MNTIERLPNESFTPREVLYRDINKLFPVFDKLAFNANIILSGAKGIGKSLACAAYAYKEQAHIVTYDCSEDARRSNLVGMHIIRGKETPFVLGPITTAFEVANETGKCVLCLEEFNSLVPAQQRVFNSITDWRRKIEVPECGKVFQLEKGAKLWIVATQNTASYAGTYSLNEDLKSRFRIIQLRYPLAEDEKLIIIDILKDKLIPYKEDQLNGMIRLAFESRTKGIEYPLSTRDVVQVMEDIPLIGIESSIKILMGKFEGSDRGAIAKRIEAIFGYSF